MSRCVDVALATDAGYLPFAATSIASCLRVQSGTRFWVLTDDTVDADQRSRLRAWAKEAGGEVVFPSVADHALAGLPPMGRYGPVVWRRFLLPGALPELARVLYLDADTLVVDSLESLWATDLGDHPIGAVANVVAPDMKGHVASLGVDPQAFFNSGVLLLDLDAMRRDDASARLIAFARDNHDRLAWPDQDALNVVFAGQWRALHPRWNAMNSFWSWPSIAEDVFSSHELEDATRDPGILHFEGPSLAKPWHYLCSHPWREKYLDVLRSTPWGDVDLEDETFLTRVVRRLPVRWQLPLYRRLLRLRGTPVS